MHVPHVVSHASQIEDAFAHLPRDVHEATQLPPSKNGVADPQVTHSMADGPVHVRQLAWHPTQTLASVSLPPEQV